MIVTNHNTILIDIPSVFMDAFTGRMMRPRAVNNNTITCTDQGGRIVVYPNESLMGRISSLRSNLLFAILELPMQEGAINA